MLLILLIPLSGIWWATGRDAHASGPNLSGMSRATHASALFGPPSGKHQNPIRPGAFIPGRKLPGLAGHATRSAGHNLVSAHVLHANSALASNVVVSSDTTIAPFGPEPRNGPQAAIDPTNSNRIIATYNDFTPGGHGGQYGVGYTLSTDGGATWTSPLLVHGLLKTDGGHYDGASDPSIAFDANGNAYLALTTFNVDDWQTAVYIAKMATNGTQFGAPVNVVSYNDTHRVAEFARVTTMGSSTVYLTFNALSTSPQAPDSTLINGWTSVLYFTQSSSSGQSWNAPIAIGTGPQDHWSTPLVTSNNTINVLYDGNTGPFLVQSTNGGTTWTTPHCLMARGNCLTSATVGETQGLNGLFLNPGPDAAVDGNTLFVVYDGSKVTLSTDGGTTWSDPMDVLGSSYEPAYLAAIGVDPSSHTVSVGGYSSAGDASGNAFNYYYAQSSDGGNHFSSPILASSNVSQPPSPDFGSIGRVSSVVGAGGMMHLFWTDTNGSGGNEQIVAANINVNQPLLGALKSSWNSGQSLPDWGLVFTGSTPQPQTIGVANYGQGSIGAVNVTPASTGWFSAAVTVDPNNANASIVTVSITSTASNHSGTITISSANGLNNSIAIPVQSLANAATPAFSLSNAALSFTAPQGIDPPSQGIQINSLSGTNDLFQINTYNDAALNVNSPNGVQNVTLNSGVPNGFVVQLTTAGLSVGSSTHKVTISDRTTSVDVTINVTITSAPAQLDDPASSLTFNYHLQDVTGPQAQNLVLHNSGGSQLDWQGSTDAAWLHLGTSTGTVATGSSQQLPVSVSVANQQMGTMIGHITLGGDVQAVNLPEVITVYLVIGPSTAQVSKTWYFAEGYASAKFNEYLTLANPNAQVANVSVTYLTQPVGKPPQAPFVRTYNVQPNSRYTVYINSVPGVVQNDQISLVVNSNIPVIAERPLYFNYTLLSPNPSGGTDVVGATHQGSVFFFPYVQFGKDQQVASPTFGTSYITYLTVLNQNITPVNVAITYEGANSIYTVTHQIAANTRGTLSLASDFPLASSSIANSYLYTTALLVTTDAPVIVELPSYFTQPNNGLASGTDEIGAPAPQTNWDFAEGYTGTNTNQFLTYLDLANAGDAPTTATLTLAVTNGTTPLAPVTRQYVVPPQSSISVRLNELVCPTGIAYCGYSVGSHIAATQPLVVDRQMFFNYQGKIPGATAVVGSTGSRAQFNFAEGYTGAGFSEYLTIVNPATNTGGEQVTIRYLIQGGSPKTVTLSQLLQPSQRWTEIVTNDVGANQQVSVVVTSSTGTLIVERPMYFNYLSQVPGGSDVIGYSAGN